MITTAENEKLKDPSATARKNLKLLCQVGGGVDITVKLFIHANGGICANKPAKSSLCFTIPAVVQRKVDQSERKG
jgi:hypothetical protein